MSTIIEDGTGTGKKLAINGRNEAKTFAVTESESQAATLLGFSHNINTGDIISLTAGDASILYFKNDEDVDIVIEKVCVGIRGFTGLTDRAVVTIIRNPTAGDIISDATAVSMNQNRNFGSSKSLKSTTLTYKGKAAGTITGGNDIIQRYLTDNTSFCELSNIELPRGSAIGIKIDSDATAGTCFAELVMHIVDIER